MLSYVSTEGKWGRHYDAERLEMRRGRFYLRGKNARVVVVSASAYAQKIDPECVESREGWEGDMLPGRNSMVAFVTKINPNFEFTVIHYKYMLDRILFVSRVNEEVLSIVCWRATSVVTFSSLQLQFS